MMITSYGSRNNERVETTFWEDFTIAEHFGVSAIKDTYERAFNEWKGNIKYMTELSMVLNHKCWHFEYNQQLCELYCELWEKVDGYIMSKFKGDDIQFYLNITD